MKPCMCSLALYNLNMLACAKATQIHPFNKKCTNLLDKVQLEAIDE